MAVGGAREIATFPMVAVLVIVLCAANCAATAGVALLSITAQLFPPSIDRLMPRPLTPAKSVRLPTGEDASNPSESAWPPPPPVPNVQFCPESVEKYRPLLAARYRLALLGGSTAIPKMLWFLN